MQYLSLNDSALIEDRVQRAGLVQNKHCTPAANLLVPVCVHLVLTAFLLPSASGIRKEMEAVLSRLCCALLSQLSSSTDHAVLATLSHCISLAMCLAPQRADMHVKGGAHNVGRCEYVLKSADTNHMSLLV